MLGRLAQRLEPGPLVLRTDLKSSYRTLAKGLFGPSLCHQTTSGKALRNKANPLFPINTTIAMTRDNCGRLRRNSWLVSKRARCLRLHLHLFTVYRNYVRKRFNRDTDEWLSSAVVLGLMPRALRFSEVLRWRQDWGTRSVHPTSVSGDCSVGEVLSRSA